MADKILITGVAGFIGFHLSKKLLENNEQIIGIDNLNSYYDVSLKEDRLKELYSLASKQGGGLDFYRGDIDNIDFLENLFKKEKPRIVINLAAQAGVRYSLINPRAYINSNIIGFFNILECCKKFSIKKLLYASSSSVYGGNTKIPFSESDEVKYPVSLYAASKLSNELMAYTYNHLYKISSLGFRFFTVYGPWGRPDMAPMIFTNSILNKLPIRIFNNGNMSRDFTYIDDVIELIFRALNKLEDESNLIINTKSNKGKNTSNALIFNVGNSKPVKLMNFIDKLEEELGIKAIYNFESMQPGDVKDTYADNSRIQEWLDYEPITEISDGINKFIEWYKNYY